MHRERESLRAWVADAKQRHPEAHANVTRCELCRRTGQPLVFAWGKALCVSCSARYPTTTVAKG